MMRISSFANNLILVNNRLVGHERQCVMKFYRLRFSKERKGVLADRMGTRLFILTSMIVKGLHYKEGNECHE